MKINDLIRLGAKHISNTFRESIYLTFGKDITRPADFYCLINERCNARCRYCDFWRRDKYREEMTIEEWKKALISIKKFVGIYSINFSGGEPFIKKGMIDILKFLYKNKIKAGITTNGSTLTNKEMINEFVSAHPFNLNISCESSTPEIHDYIRGVKGLHEKLTKSVSLVLESQKEQNIYFPIIMKTTINSLNFRQLPEQVRWAKKVGFTAVNFQPIEIWTEETKSLFIREKDFPELRAIVKELIHLKRKEYPILNSEEMLKLVISHFKGLPASVDAMPCRIGLRNFSIKPDGEVFSCINFPAIGNINDQSAKSIWYGKKAKKMRELTVGCKQLCLRTCLSQKKIIDKIKMGLKLLKK